MRRFFGGRKDEPGAKSSTFTSTLPSRAFQNRLRSYATQTLGSGGSLNRAVELPRGEHVITWLVASLMESYEDLSVIWSVVSEDSDLKAFKAGEGFPDGVEYRWKGENQMSGPQYISTVMNWEHATLTDPSIFPGDEATAIATIWTTPAFAATVSNLWKRQFRVWAILYSSFFKAFETLGMAETLNSSFKMFMFFVFEYNLVPEKEMEAIGVIVGPIREAWQRGRNK